MLDDEEEKEGMMMMMMMRTLQQVGNVSQISYLRQNA
jgi:hypothetical protein